MGKKQKIYWLCQLGGWLFYVIINLLFFGINNKATLRDILNYFLLFLMGITLTHLNRLFILKYTVLKLKIAYQIGFIIFSSLVLSALFFIIGTGIGVAVLSIENIINGVVPFTFWSFIYFGFHYLDNYKKTEIENLRWEAASKEIELNKLKSQLNPHFMFNSMNSIRALIDENPDKAKEAVTQLSNILRNILLMNKNKEILLLEELQIVKDYLALEKIRYEERLQFSFDTKPETLNKSIPPLLIQTQVENAIKHGISKLPEGGIITVSTSIIANNLVIEVNNTGQINSQESDTGFGLANSKQRLELLYGKKAGIEMKNTNNNRVNVKINIPVN